jgi:hypothetical protein
VSLQRNESYFDQRCVMVNRETLRTLQGEIKVPLDCRLMVRPLFNAKPLASCQKMNELDGTLLCVDEKSLFKIPLNENERVELRFKQKIFLIRKNKLFIRFASKIQVLDLANEEIIASIEGDFGFKIHCFEHGMLRDSSIESNKMLSGMIYSPEFDEIATFVFLFDYENKNSERMRSFSPIDLDEAKVYVIDAFCSLRVDRRFSIEHAAINKDFSFVKGHADKHCIFSFSLCGKNKNKFCQIDNAFNLARVSELDGFFILDFNSNNLLVCENETKMLRIFNKGNKLRE